MSYCAEISMLLTGTPVLQLQATVQGKASPWCYQKQLPKAWTGTKSVNRWADDSCQDQT